MAALTSLCFAPVNCSLALFQSHVSWTDTTQCCSALTLNWKHCIAYIPDTFSIQPTVRLAAFWSLEHVYFKNACGPQAGTCNSESWVDFMISQIQCFKGTTKYYCCVTDAQQIRGKQQTGLSWFYAMNTNTDTIATYGHHRWWSLKHCFQFWHGVWHH